MAKKKLYTLFIFKISKDTKRKRKGNNKVIEMKILF